MDAATAGVASRAPPGRRPERIPESRPQLEELHSGEWVTKPAARGAHDARIRSRSATLVQSSTSSRAI
jgi:hypothetical protein